MGVELILILLCTLLTANIALWTVNCYLDRRTARLRAVLESRGQGGTEDR